MHGMKYDKNSHHTVLLSDKPSTEGLILLVSHNQNKNTYEGDRDWEKKDNLLSSTIFRSVGHETTAVEMKKSHHSFPDIQVR